MRKRSIDRPRVAGFDYAGQHAYHVTITTRARAPILNGDRAIAVMSVLNSGAPSAFEVLLSTLMPDHLHVLLASLSETSNLIRYVQRFKQVTSHRCIQETGVRLWQPSFFDHGLRGGENRGALIRYIIENPARAGVVEHSGEWPYQGGSLLATRGHP